MVGMNDSIPLDAFDASQTILLMFHDDRCGELLDETGQCPACGFSPDMQSTGFRDVSIGEYAQMKHSGRTFLGLRRTRL